MEGIPETAARVAQCANMGGARVNIPVTGTLRQVPRAAGQEAKVTPQAGTRTTKHLRMTNGSTPHFSAKRGVRKRRHGT